MAIGSRCAFAAFCHFGSAWQQDLAEVEDDEKLKKKLNYEVIVADCRRTRGSPDEVLALTRDRYPLN